MSTGYDTIQAIYKLITIVVQIELRIQEYQYKPYGPILSPYGVINTIENTSQIEEEIRNNCFDCTNNNTSLDGHTFSSSFHNNHWNIYYFHVRLDNKYLRE